MVESLVTVVILNYNAGDVLLRCVEQVLASTIPVKVIVADNASTDNSLTKVDAFAKDHPNVVVHRNGVNGGFSAGNNAVYPLISSPFVLYLNPDCFVKHDTIEHLLQTMNDNPQAGIIGCLVTNIDGTEQLGCRGLTPTPLRVFNQMFKLGKLFPNNPKLAGYILNNELPKEPIEVELISGSCMFIRKQAIDEVGLLDDNYFLYCEDYDWFYRFLKGNWKIIFTPNTNVAHIKGHITKQIPFRVLVYKARGMWRYHNKFFKDNSNITTTLLVRAGILGRLASLGSMVLLRRLLRKGR